MFVYAEACPPLPNTTTITGVGSSGYAGDLTPQIFMWRGY